MREGSKLPSLVDIMHCFWTFETISHDFFFKTLGAIRNLFREDRWNVLTTKLRWSHSFMVLLTRGTTCGITDKCEVWLKTQNSMIQILTKKRSMQNNIFISRATANTQSRSIYRQRRQSFKKVAGQNTTLEASLKVKISRAPNRSLIFILTFILKLNNID